MVICLCHVTWSLSGDQPSQLSFKLDHDRPPPLFSQELIEREEVIEVLAAFSPVISREHVGHHVLLCGGTSVKIEAAKVVHEQVGLPFRREEDLIAHSSGLSDHFNLIRHDFGLSWRFEGRTEIEGRINQLGPEFEGEAEVGARSSEIEG